MLWLSAVFTSISIPYRQTQNRRQTPRIRPGGHIFQFLIGRLKTSLKSDINVNLPYFNSLQVDSKLNEMAFDHLCICLFQFLIGRLKTSEKVQYKRSILRFQFLIGRLKTLLSSPPCYPDIVFQFLIGRLKTRLPRDSATRANRDFNSLSVDSKPVSQYPCYPPLSYFNSLQVDSKQR